MVVFIIWLALIIIEALSLDPRTELIGSCPELASYET